MFSFVLQETKIVLKNSTRNFLYPFRPGFHFNRPTFFGENKKTKFEKSTCVFCTIANKNMKLSPKK